MSAPLAGKFVDHYEVLGVESKADANAIKDAYARLAAKLNPKNAITGDKEKFHELNNSYEILVDPELRKAFDAVRGGGGDDSSITFPVKEFLEDLEADAARRMCLLALLYYRRKYFSISPGISLRQLDSVIHISPEQLAFITWVLKQQGLVTSDDKSRLLITVTGIQFVEKNKPAQEMILPWLKAEAVVTEAQASAASAPAQLEAATPPPPIAEPVATVAPPAPTAPEPSNPTTAGLSSLRAALQRTLGPAKPPVVTSKPAGR